MEISKIKILLASKSPRRKQLFELAQFDMKVVDIDVDETLDAQTKAEDAAEFLARKKASAVLSIHENEVLVTADTIVIVDNEILNKPQNKEEAIGMLSKLSNNTHLVNTGVCIKTSSQTHSFTETTAVFIDNLTIQEIEYYIQHFKPFDKAGSYGVQDWLGVTHVSKIEGCYYNVMGFPMPRFYKELQKIISE